MNEQWKELKEEIPKNEKVGTLFKIRWENKLECCLCIVKRKRNKKKYLEILSKHGISRDGNFVLLSEGFSKQVQWC